MMTIRNRSAGNVGLKMIQNSYTAKSGSRSLYASFLYIFQTAVIQNYIFECNLEQIANTLNEYVFRWVKLYAEYERLQPDSKYSDTGNGWRNKYPSYTVYCMLYAIHKKSTMKKWIFCYFHATICAWQSQSQSQSNENEILQLWIFHNVGNQHNKIHTLCTTANAVIFVSFTICRFLHSHIRTLAHSHTQQCYFLCGLWVFKMWFNEKRQPTKSGKRNFICAMCSVQLLIL